MKTSRKVSMAAEREWLQLFTRWAKGDPSLSAWEAQFIADVANRQYAVKYMRLSHRQAEIIDQISTKLGYSINAPPRIPDEYEGSESVADEDGDVP